MFGPSGVSIGQIRPLRWVNVANLEAAAFARQPARPSRIPPLDLSSLNGFVWSMNWPSWLRPKKSRGTAEQPLGELLRRHGVGVACLNNVMCSLTTRSVLSEGRCAPAGDAPPTRCADGGCPGGRYLFFRPCNLHPRADSNRYLIASMRGLGFSRRGSRLGWRQVLVDAVAGAPTLASSGKNRGKTNGLAEVLHGRKPRRAFLA